ncbi:hypothetical protein GUITHDRAFT_151136, partial [Guillardia theta CCMP2712]
METKSLEMSDAAARSRSNITIETARAIYAQRHSSKSSPKSSSELAALYHVSSKAVRDIWTNLGACHRVSLDRFREGQICPGQDGRVFLSFQFFVQHRDSCLCSETSRPPSRV